MAGRAAVVSIDMNPGRVILFGLRPAAPRPDARDVPAAVQRALHVGDRRGAGRADERSGIRKVGD